ncbi:MAG: hypothetical protein IJD38_05845 [Clostridia bacterium]|nr:hypothetical protein [Clostridia bacterium]
MNSITFSAAKAVFFPAAGTTPESPLAPEPVAVSQYGFYRALDLTSEDGFTPEQTVIRLTARNVYRLYVNGEVVMHGPARTAHGYCRVDEVDITEHLIDGVNHIAVEVVAYGRDWPGYNLYSNDCTLEDGLFIAEIEADGQVICATGQDAWQVCSINRSPVCERISHSRECVEIYTLDDDFYLWKLGYGIFQDASIVGDEPVYLAHEALMPTLKEYFFEEVTGFGAVKVDPELEIEEFFYEKGHPIFASLPERPTTDCRRSVEDPNGTVRADFDGEGLVLTPENTTDYFASWDGGESRVGFIRIAVTCEQAGVIDIVRSEIMDTDGTLPYYFNNVTRLHVPAGLTEFVTMEPALARYMQVYFRGVGRVTVHSLSVLEDSYPDEKRASFLCSNDDINRLYKAARKTLLLNTLDIFMDCPERERGGWLCDSLWTGRAASLTLSDNRVEREYLENFLLTPADGMFHSFFPEVYPALKPSYKDMTGITTWTFWLMVEVCEFIRRTGDIVFREEHKPRIEAFVKGSRDFIGKSGLLENLPWLFIDWSMSNLGEHQQPVSSAANALYAYMMERLGETFGHPDWVTEGKTVRNILRKAILDSGKAETLRLIPDSFTVDESGGLHSRGRYSEAATYTSLWCGLFTPEESPLLIKTVRDKMGPAPVFAKDPMVGDSQLFIGLCIRLDMLTRLGCYDKCYEDMLAIFIPQLTEGPGTLWENRIIDTSSRCHGFTSHAGVHLMRDVLGLGFPLFDPDGEGDPVLEITPHICGLRWARGTRETPEGLVSVDWRYDEESFILRVTAPKSYDCRVILPKEAKMLDAEKVSVIVKGY